MNVPSADFCLPHTCSHSFICSGIEIMGWMVDPSDILTMNIKTNVCVSEFCCIVVELMVLST